MCQEKHTSFPIIYSLEKSACPAAHTPVSLKTHSGLRPFPGFSGHSRTLFLCRAALALSLFRFTLSGFDNDSHTTVTSINADSGHETPLPEGFDFVSA